MKRFCVIFICVAFCICFAACANDRPDTASTSGAEQTSGMPTDVPGSDNVIGWNDPIDSSGVTPASSSQKSSSESTEKLTDASPEPTSSRSTSTQVTDTEPLPPWTDSEYSRVVK